MTDNANIDVDLTRVFDAPRQLVYKAFTDPDLVGLVVAAASVAFIALG